MMQARKTFEERFEGYGKALSDAGLLAKVEYSYKNESHERCEESSSSYYAAKFGIYHEDNLLFEKEYYLPMDATEIYDADFSEIEELIAIANDTDNAPSAVSDYIKEKNKKAEDELSLLEDGIDRGTKRLIAICAIALGITALVAIVLPFIL